MFTLSGTVTYQPRVVSGTESVTVTVFGVFDREEKPGTEWMPGPMSPRREAGFG
jgi:hypothetical protein